MIARRGCFVAIESLDGIGKTTLVANLARDRGGVAMATPGVIKPLIPDILAALGDDQAGRCLLYASTVLAEGGRARQLADAGQFVVMDRYWLSTIAYARARGVAADLSGIEAIVPIPDVTVLLTLDEDERVRRLASRGATTEADRETLNPHFRAAVLREMRRADQRREGLRAIEVDLSGADEARCVLRILEIVRGLA